jgi:CheY-like chemotaxis protein
MTVAAKKPTIPSEGSANRLILQAQVAVPGLLSKAAGGSVASRCIAFGIRAGEMETSSSTSITLSGSALSTPGLDANNTVLLAEDEGSLLGALSYVLQMEGFQVLTASDGDEALVIARRERPLVAILDVLMPRMGGDAVCSSMRADPALDSTFVVLISALPARQAERIARESDADLFLRKPVDHDLLLEIISSVFEHRAGRAPVRVAAD